ncbi:MAG: alpha/beta hydrolase [Chloroflexi bacterium]|nr:MAG: alpha/beta hydrolase [Chloroflexota bacterium]
MSYIVQGLEFGTDGAIVLLHDIVAGAFVWADVMPHLASLKRAVYAIDLLGYGESDHPWPADTSNWGQADGLNMLFEQLKLTNIILVGHGFGGSVAQVLATRLSRERVAALVLIDSTCYEHSFAENWPLPEMKKRQDYDAPKETKVEDMIRDLGETLPSASVNPQRFRDFMSDYIDQWNSELGKEVLFQQIRLLNPNYTNSVASDLKVLGKPVLITWGEKDQQTPLKLAQRLHRDIPESRLVIIPDAGHLVLFDAPEAVGSTLVDFIKGL